ncbi:MAG: hypothetical protein RL531_786 [Actinomycetota bacterium]
MARTRSSTGSRRMILRTVAALLVGGLALAACGSESSDSGGEDGSTSTTMSRRAVRAVCDAAVDAADAASTDLSEIANGHIDAFNAAIDAIEAWDTGDTATFTAKAAEFRAFAANEANQGARIEADRATIRRTEQACRRALGGEEMSPACEQAIDLLERWREHTYELITAADGLYAAGEQLLRGAETDNQSMIDAALSQIDAAGSEWDAGLADDDEQFDAVDGALTKCRKGDTTLQSRADPTGPSVRPPADQ